MAGRRTVAVRAQAAQTIIKSNVPLQLEQGDMPLNTYNSKAPFIAKIKSVERIVGPKATGETCNIVIETDGKIPFWEGQSYGVVPPVSRWFDFWILPHLNRCMGPHGRLGMDPCKWTSGLMN